MKDGLNPFLEAVSQAVENGEFVRLVLSDPLRKARDISEKITIRSILLRGRQTCQWALNTGRKESHENLSADETRTRISGLLASKYRQAQLVTRTQQITLGRQKNGQITLSKKTITETATPPDHNRRKQYLIPEGEPCPFLEALGIMTASGRVIAQKHDKFRQINRFAEMVEDVYQFLPANGVIRVVDFGCGRSSLTFVVHHLLQQKHQRSVEILGIDQNPQIIRHCSDVAARLQLEGLHFEAGDIANFSRSNDVSMVIVLHACDTATDDALAQAIIARVPVILAAPCCQHELTDRLVAPDLELIFKHGILKDRFAALATDGLRAALLEKWGYRTQVMEFIELEHTAKNLLIRAVRPRNQEQACGAIPRKITEFKQLLGITEFALETRLRELGLESRSGCAADYES